MFEGIEEHIESLYNDYQAAIKSEVIEDILRTGELYFGYLHDGQMTQTDREQLQKDIMLCAIKYKSSKV